MIKIERNNQHINILISENNTILSLVRQIQEAFGIVGEEKTILTVLAFAVMPWINNKMHPTASNLIVTGKSGSGKDFITRKIVKELLPQERVWHRQTPSPTALKNARDLQQRKEEMLAYLEDVCEKFLKHPYNKAIFGAEKPIIASTNRNTYNTETFEFEKKPTFILTIAEHRLMLEIEYLRRVLIVRTNQDWDNYLEKISRPEPNEEIKDELRKLFSKLKEVEVETAFKGELKNLVRNTIETILDRYNVKQYDIGNTENIRINMVDKILTLVQSSALLRTLITTSKIPEKIIATKEDFKVALEIWNNLEAPEYYSLTDSLREFFREIEENFGNEEFGFEKVPMRELFSDKTIRDYLKVLENNGLLLARRIRGRGNPKRYIVNPLIKLKLEFKSDDKTERILLENEEVKNDELGVI